MTKHRVGKTLLALARRSCPSHLVDEVVVPIVADMQFESLESVNRSRLMRLWVSGKGYAALIKAVLIAALVLPRRAPVDSKNSGRMRLLLAVPIAVIVTGLVQYLVGSAAGYLLYSVGLATLGEGGEFGGRLAKVTAMGFMALAFFWTVFFVAPAQRRPRVALAALIGLSLVGGLAVFNAFRPWPEFAGWKFAMGLACLSCAVASYWAASRVGRTGGVADL
jgi:hypothetical protein